MSRLDEAVAALQQAAEGLGRAQAAAVQVDARAQQVQSRAAGAGFRGVAGRMGHVRQRLNRVREMQAAVTTTVTTTVGVIQRVTEDMSPADVVSTLSPAAQQIAAATTSTTAILSDVDGLKSDIAAALQGGQPGRLIAMADQVRQALVQVVSTLGATKQRTDDVIDEARQMGNFLPGMAAHPLSN